MKKLLVLFVFLFSVSAFAQVDYIARIGNTKYLAKGDSIFALTHITYKPFYKVQIAVSDSANSATDSLYFESKVPNTTTWVPTAVVNGTTGATVAILVPGDGKTVIYETSFNVPISDVRVRRVNVITANLTKRTGVKFTGLYHPVR